MSDDLRQRLAGLLDQDRLPRDEFQIRMDALYRAMDANGWKAVLIYGDAAELSYRNRDNKLFSLYLRRSDGKARFDQFARDGLRVCV